MSKIKSIINKIILQEMKNLKEYDKISYDDFVNLPARPLKKPGMYSKEGILAANKKVSSVVQKYLQENPSVTSTNFDSRVISDYISKEIPGFASITALDNLQRKYKSLSIYFGYLISSLKEAK